LTDRPSTTSPIGFGGVSFSTRTHFAHTEQYERDGYIIVKGGFDAEESAMDSIAYMMDLQAGRTTV
jgi:hypothetical protein